ncbi:protein YbfC, partial [Escherichia coli]
MKRVLFFLLMIFVSFGVIADCEIQAKDHDCFTIFAKGTIFSAFPVLNNKTMWRWYQ